MSPRGVAIPGVERRLFDAAQRILERNGAAGLSSRAITAEAGTANGLLYRHFVDLDAFLAAFVLDRAGSVSSGLAHLPEQAGSATVAENLTNAALSIAPAVAVLIDLVHTRPSLALRLNEAGHAHESGLEAIERSFADYLDAERAIGRVAQTTDSAAVALALVASVHRLSLSYRSADPELSRQVERVVASLEAGMRGTEPAR